jgi:predicted O-methyltransferase YrrM
VTTPTRFDEELLARTLRAITESNAERIALIGSTASALQLRAELHNAGLHDRLLGIFDPHADANGKLQDPRPLQELVDQRPDLIVVCADEQKTEILHAYIAAGGEQEPLPRVVIAGSAHLAFRDPVFDELEAPALVPSYATGSPHTRVHLYQCLKAAAANELSGAIVEFGAFKGGTTAWLARAAQRLGLDAKVIGFDTWEGFPPRRSLFDLYEHPRCVFSDLGAARAYTDRYGIELVPGDIADTYRRLEAEELLLCFFDTDNYTPTRAALALCLRQLVVGGSLVFDHVATTPEYIDTLGERAAAYEILGESDLLHLHGTGVFIKVR